MGSRTGIVPLRCIHNQSIDKVGCSCAVRRSASVGTMPRVFPKALTSTIRLAVSRKRARSSGRVTAEQADKMTAAANATVSPAQALNRTHRGAQNSIMLGRLLDEERCDRRRAGNLRDVDQQLHLGMSELLLLFG